MWTTILSHETAGKTRLGKAEPGDALTRGLFREQVEDAVLLDQSTLDDAVGDIDGGVIVQQECFVLRHD